MTDDTMPGGSPTIRTIAVPADTNPAGDIFGGCLMSQMDLAAGSVASLSADLIRTGRSSMHIHVEAWRRDRDRETGQKVTEATFTFVALDENGRSRPVHAGRAGPDGAVRPAPAGVRAPRGWAGATAR